MLKLQWTTSKRKVKDLKHWDENPRTIGSSEMQRLKERIAERGFHDVIKIDTNNDILSGNMRKDALSEMGIEEVNVLVPNRKLTVEEKVKVGLESNISDGAWDFEKLSEFDESILSSVGFNSKDIDKIFGDGDDDDDFDAEAEYEKIPKAKTKRGDIYILGTHNLMCGDATDALEVQKLMAGKKAHMVFTDPPYNVDYQGGGSYADHKTPTRKKIENDKMSAGDFNTFLDASLKNMLEHCDGAFYICMSSKELASLKDVFEKNGGHWQSFIIWVKNTFTLSRSDWQNQYEPILYGWSKDVKNHFFAGFRDEGNVWENLEKLRPVYDGKMTTIKIGDHHLKIKGEVEGKICRKKDCVDIWYEKKPAKSADHPTMKPIRLMEKAIKASSLRDQIVLDLFGGSGSTLIAAELTGRQCRMMELDERYCDVIVKRWEKLTGKKAEKLV